MPREVLSLAPGLGLVRTEPGSCAMPGAKAASTNRGEVTHIDGHFIKITNFKRHH